MTLLGNKQKTHPKVCLKWSGRRDSNSRQSAWKADTLPTELLPQSVLILSFQVFYGFKFSVSF